MVRARKHACEHLNCRYLRGDILAYKIVIETAVFKARFHRVSVSARKGFFLDEYRG